MFKAKRNVVFEGKLYHKGMDYDLSENEQLQIGVNFEDLDEKVKDKKKTPKKEVEETKEKVEEEVDEKVEEKKKPKDAKAKRK